MKPKLNKKNKSKVHIKKNRSPKGKKSLSLFLKIAKWITVFLIWGMVSLSLVLFWYSYNLPDVKSLEKTVRQPNIIIKARDASIITSYGDIVSNNIVSIKTLPVHIKNAFLSIEDKRFYEHFGIDIIGLLRAFWTNYHAGVIKQGGSTLTQQLAKNFLISEKLFKASDRSLRRKIQELLLSIWLEKKFNKDQIFSIYLNRSYFGSGTYGIEAASQKYFNKNARKLDLYEAALIAGLVKAPSRYSPLNSQKLAVDRAMIVLSKMIDSGFIKESDKDNFKINFFRIKNSPAPYFSDWIMDSISSYVDLNQDLIVFTTLDPCLQKLSKQKTDGLIDKYSKSRNVEEIALVSMTPSGAVRSMIGGKDYSVSKFNRATQAQRQPGSAVKLFAYLAALEHGLTLNTMINDKSIRVGKWKPKNYGWKSRGQVSLKDGFAYSVNTVAVRLAHKVGLKSLSEIVRRLTSLNQNYSDLSISLGTNEISLLNLTSAYSVVANHGFMVSPYGITEIRDRNDRILYKRTRSNLDRVIDRKHIIPMLTMLRAVMDYGTGRRFKLTRPCAGKTGTSQDHRDAWFIGFTPDLVTGIWLGNDDGKPMNKVVGGNLAAEVWYNFMQAAHNNLNVRDFL